LEAQNGLKKVFYSIFVVNKAKIRILKCVFLAFFRAKMTKIDIQNPKQIVPMIINSFWHIQISDGKHEFLLVKLKVRKNGIS